MRIGDDLAVGSVDARGILVLTLASFEHVVLSLVGTVVLDTNTIIDVLAKRRGVGTGRIADLEAEGVGSHEAIHKSQLKVKRQNRTNTNLCHSITCW